MVPEPAPDALFGDSTVRRKRRGGGAICAGCVSAGGSIDFACTTNLGRRSLRAAIVGGGIGGISAACSLRHRGVDVTVFEQAKALGEIGAGVLLLPNGLRQLERMGLGEALAAVGAKIGEGSQILPG